MKAKQRQREGRTGTVVLWTVSLALVLGIVGSTQLWLPYVQRLAGQHGPGGGAGGQGHGPDEADHQHAGSAATHEGHDDATALQLSRTAWKNIGLTIGVAEPRDYVKTVAVPAMVVERPGHSQIEVVAPMNGIVTRVHVVAGQIVQPGDPLFELRLTHEDLVTAQREFLEAAQELDVVETEIRRLEAVGEGVVAGRRVLEQRYEQQKLQARQHAQRQGLLLHGLDNAQVDSILESRRLIQSLVVSAPPFETGEDHHEIEHLYHVQSIVVHRGQHVVAGDALGALGDHCQLYVEGQAFEDDAQRLIELAGQRGILDVVPVLGGVADSKPLRLALVRVADHVDPESRALHFYLLLDNNRYDDQPQNGRRFVAWRFRPGQRMVVQVPVGDPWENQLVLPSAAIVEEGAEAFVFQLNGDHFDRVPVHVVYRDKDSCVIENDGELAGRTIAMSGAYQMHLAIKAKAGGGVNHHGHSH